jgi:hypothetical protein
MEYYKQQYDKRADKIREQYKNQPDIEDKWLEIYKDRLKRRGEEDVYVMMEQGHRVLVKDILSVETKQ